MKKWLVVILLFCVGFQTFKKWERITLWWALRSSPPPWAQEQLARDFADFPAITQEALDQTFEKVQKAQLSTFRYRIVEGEIYRMGTPNDRSFVFEKILKRIQRSKALPNVDFIICMNDGVPESYAPPDFWVAEKQAPLFAWARREGLARYVVLIPDFLTTKESSWHREIDTVNAQYRAIPWQERKEIAFWRGVSNDKGYTLENYRQKPRFLIGHFSKLHPDLIDAGFSRVYPEEVAKAMESLGLIVGHMPVSGHLAYKYLPVLDGYMCTFPGYQWRLLSGSLAFKQESDEVQYFYAALKPYVHYIPIKNDMSDLAEKVLWAKTHDPECHQISQNARQFALDNLMPNQIYAYLYWVLQRQAALQTFRVESHMNLHWVKVL